MSSFGCPSTAGGRARHFLLAFSRPRDIMKSSALLSDNSCQARTIHDHDSARRCSWASLRRQTDASLAQSPDRPADFRPPAGRPRGRPARFPTPCPPSLSRRCAAGRRPLGYRPPLLHGAKTAVPGIAQAGHDVLLGIQVRIDAGGVDRHFRMRPADRRNPFRRRN